MIKHDPRLSRWATGLAVALAAASLAGLSACDSKEETNPTGPRKKSIPVRVAEVRWDTLRETVRGIGTLQAAETVEIKPEIDGLITEIHIAEGDAVEKGQILVSIDDEKLRRQLAAGKAALRAATVRRDEALREYRRIQNLFDRGIEIQDARDRTEATYLAADAEVARMEAEVQLLQARLDDTRILAPFDGVISEHSVDPGDYVKAGDYLATLHRISQMEVAFTVPERFMGRVKPAQPVAVTVTAFPEREFPGEVYFVSPQIDKTTRDFLVKARVENQDGLLKPGAFGTAVVTIDVHEQVPVVPEKALVATRTGYIVYVVNNHIARRHEVRIGLRETGKVEIRAGLEPGEKVVIEGQLNISDGAAVRLPGDEREQSGPTTQPATPESEDRP
ncbi:MAG: efflux RND transporter periplasmic adaptor subunit [Planctomycetota bacterium]